MQLDHNVIEQLEKDAKLSNSKRAHKLFHSSSEAAIQQIAFCLLKDTLIDVHKHKCGTETIICLRGAIAITRLLDNNKFKTIVIDENNPIYKFNPLEWHTYTPLEENTIGFEIKEGPYTPENFTKHELYKDQTTLKQLHNQIQEELNYL